MQRPPKVRLQPCAEEILKKLAHTEGHETYELVMALLSQIQMLCLTHEHVPTQLCHRKGIKYFHGHNHEGVMLLETIQKAHEIEMIIWYDEMLKQLTIELRFVGMIEQYHFRIFVETQGLVIGSSGS